MLAGFGGEVDQVSPEGRPGIAETVWPLGQGARTFGEAAGRWPRSNAAGTHTGGQDGGR
jgi:hypothetical protein